MCVSGRGSAVSATVPEIQTHVRKSSRLSLRYEPSHLTGTLEVKVEQAPNVMLLD